MVRRWRNKEVCERTLYRTASHLHSRRALRTRFMKGRRRGEEEKRRRGEEEKRRRGEEGGV
jgi:hypothetical protein